MASLSTIILPSQRRDVFPASAPHMDTLNRRYRREEPPKHPGGQRQHPDVFVPSHVKQRLPIGPVPLAGKAGQPVPPQLRPGFNPHANGGSSCLGNIPTKSSPDLRLSTHRQDAQSGTMSAANFRFGAAHGHPEFRPISAYDNVPTPFIPTQRMRTSSNPSPAHRPTSSLNEEAWCSTAPEVPNFSRKIPIKDSLTIPSESNASGASSNSPAPAVRASQQSMGNSPPPSRTYKPATPSPLSRPKSISIADMQMPKLGASQAPVSPLKPLAPNRPPSSALFRAEDGWRNAANLPPFSRNALEGRDIIMPLRASDIKKSKPEEQNLTRLKRGSKSCAELRSSAQSFETSPRQSRLVVTNPDVVGVARPVPFERPPSCLRSSVASSHSQLQPKVPKKVRIADDPTFRSPPAQVDTESLLDVKVNLDRISTSSEYSFNPPPRFSSMISTQKYVRRRSKSVPNASATMQKKDAPKMSDWLDSSSDELKRFFCPSPSPPSTSPNSSPHRQRETKVAEKEGALPPRPTPLLRFSKSSDHLTSKLNTSRIPLPPLPKLDTHIRSSSDDPPPRPRLPSPIFSAFYAERTNSGATTSSSSSNDTCTTDRSAATMASSKTSIESPPSILRPSAAKPSEKHVQLPPPPKSSADLWRKSDDEAEMQHPRTIISQAARNPPVDARKANKPDKRPNIMTKLASGLGFGSRKPSGPKGVRCNCGITTANLHYKKYH